MAEPDTHTGATLSLLDRLTEKRASLTSRAELKASLCEDLAALLNTRRAENDFDSRYEQAANSLLAFGVIDFTPYNLRNAIEQERVRHSIERAIRLFEPRLSRVTVTLEEPDPLQPVLRFQISALLRTESPGQAILFDVALHRESRRIAVTGAN
jgi:type VI secretion system protein ImpF